MKAATTAFTFKTLLRHYVKRALTQRSLNRKLGPRRNYHKGRAAIRHYLPDGEDDPHGGPAEDVAHVHGEAGEEAGAAHAVLAAAGL